MATSQILSLQLVRDPAPPASPSYATSQDRGSDLTDLFEGGDIKRHIWSLPTREDLERFANRVEKAFKQDIAQFKSDIAQLGNRLKTLEQRFDDALPTISLLKDRCAVQDQKIKALLCQLDKFKNHSRWENIHIRGLPEATAPRDIIPTLIRIFWDILELLDTSTIEIDCAHRALGSPSEDPDNPQDIICKLHKYTLKDHIMQKMHKKPYFDFDGARFSSNKTSPDEPLCSALQLCLLLAAVQEAGLTYR